MPSFMPMVPLGLRMIVLRGIRAIGGAERVVVEAVAGDDQNDGKGEHPREEDAELVAALGIFAGENGGLYASFGTHGLSSPNCTWMVARNR